MFRAAATVGQATRPVLAYYGLNQAGRAVAAVASTIQADGWRLSGHGIYAKNLESSLPDIAITCDRLGARGSFAKLSEILDSPLWNGSIAFRVFWDSIPETRLRPLVDDQARRSPLYVDETSIYGDPHPLATVPVAYFPPWLISSDNGRKDLDRYLDAYPGARSYHSYVRTGRGPNFEPQFSRHVDGWGELQMNWQVAEDGTPCTVDRRLEFIRSITRSYSGNRYFFPAPGNSDSEIHPLMAWWAVLHSLSMLARYQPAEWSAHIDVDRSQYAVALEVLLNEALVVVPALIADTIEQVVASSTRPLSQPRIWQSSEGRSHDLIQGSQDLGAHAHYQVNEPSLVSVVLLPGNQGSSCKWSAETSAARYAEVRGCSW